MKRRPIDYYGGKLREKGHRVTPQRLEVIGALLELAHPTVNRIREQVEKRHPTVSPATIYAALDLLEEIGELIPIEAGGKTRYDLSPSPHPHLIEEESGKVRDLKEGTVEESFSEFIELAPEGTTRVELNFYLA